MSRTCRTCYYCGREAQSRQITGVPICSIADRCLEIPPTKARPFTVTRPFSMGYELATQAEWDAMLDEPVDEYAARWARFS